MWLLTRLSVRHSARGTPIASCAKRKSPRRRWHEVISLEGTGAHPIDRASTWPRHPALADRSLQPAICRSPPRRWRASTEFRGRKGVAPSREQLRCATVVEVQEPAEPFAPKDGRVVVRRRGRCRDQVVLEALMVALDVVVLDELDDRAPKVPLAKRDHLAQALRLDRQDEALRVCVQVGTASGQLDARHASGAKREGCRGTQL